MQRSSGSRSHSMCYMLQPVIFICSSFDLLILWFGLLSVALIIGRCLEAVLS